MSDPPGARGAFKGFAADHPRAKGLALAIGGFLANFGSLELMSRAWLSALTADDVLRDAVAALRLGQRLQVIEKLITAGRVPAAFSPEANDVWSKVRKLSELRNQLAHNPVALVWEGPDQSGDPDYIGVADDRKSVKRPDGVPSLITEEELKRAQDEAVTLVRKLDDLAQRIERAGDWPAHPSPRPPSTA
jgi:hypothetical protein